MSDPWSSVVPSVVTSVVTTGVLFAGSKVVGAATARRSRRKTPLLIRRREGEKWSVVNRTKQLMLTVQVRMVSADGLFPDPALHQESPGNLLPGAEGFFGLHDGRKAHNLDGYTLTFTWVEHRRGRPEAYYQILVRVKKDVDVYTPEREPLSGAG